MGSDARQAGVSGKSKDKGATLDVAKRFDSGVTVGVWAALTNVSKEDYGEGGFSKGFYISIPLDLMTICSR